jgi:opacity protein-like surface antigen
VQWTVGQEERGDVVARQLFVVAAAAAAAAAVVVVVAAAAADEVAVAAEDPELVAGVEFVGKVGVVAVVAGANGYRWEVGKPKGRLAGVVAARKHAGRHYRQRVVVEEPVQRL